MSITPTISVEGIALPEPHKYDATISSFVDSGRNVRGEMVGSEIRGNIAKISISYEFISAQDLSTVLKLFSKDHGGSFVREVTFLDMVSNSWQTRKMYVSDRSGGIMSRDPDTGVVDGYNGVKFSLIEV